jgi:hypothetical protein
MPGRVKLSSTNYPNDDCGIVKPISHGPGKPATFQGYRHAFLLGLLKSAANQVAARMTNWCAPEETTSLFSSTLVNPPTARHGGHLKHARHI